MIAWIQIHTTRACAWFLDVVAVAIIESKSKIAGTLVELRLVVGRVILQELTTRFMYNVSLFGIPLPLYEGCTNSIHTEFVVDIYLYVIVCQLLCTMDCFESW